MFVPDQESEWASIYLLGIDSAALYDFFRDIGIAPTVRYFLFFQFIKHTSNHLTSSFIFNEHVIINSFAF